MSTTLSVKRTESQAPDGRSWPIPTSEELEASGRGLSQQAEQARAAGRRVVLVQGLGFVGAAVAAVLAAAEDDDGLPRFFVIGLDLPRPDSYWKIARINEGSTPIDSPDPELGQLTRHAALEQHNLVATAWQPAYSLADVVIVDVPLDVTDASEHDARSIELRLDPFREAIRAIGRHMRPEALVVLETTLPIGTTERIVAPLLREERQQRGIDSPLYLAHAYERVMPGPRYVDSIRRFWRSFAAADTESADRARQFLGSFVDTDSHPLTELESPAASEMAKLLENSYRAVNIAFIHEWTLLAEKLGINLFEVIDSIRVRRGTHDNIRLPGFGVGGYCLPKDALLAQWSSIHLFETGHELGMTLEALSINRDMPLHTFDLVSELAGGNFKGKTILVCGIAYLPDVADLRNSPSETLVDALLAAGASPRLHDPCVETWSERPELPLESDFCAAIDRADGIVLAVPHRAYLDLDPLVLAGTTGEPPFLVDAQNVLDDTAAERLHQRGSRVLGVGKGHWRKRGYHLP